MPILSAKAVGQRQTTLGDKPSREPVLQQLAIFGLLLLVALAGCGNPGTPDIPAPNGGRELVLRLDELSEGSDLVEVHLEGSPGSMVSLELIDVYPLDSDLPYCTVYGFAGREVASLGARNPLRISSSDLGEPVNSASVLSRGLFNFTFSDALEFPANGRLMVTFAYANADSWRAAGATSLLKATSEDPMKWSKPQPGRMECLTDFAHYDEGEYYVTPAASSATQLRHEFTLTNHGFLWFTPSADLGYRFVLTHDGSEFVADEHGPMEASEAYLHPLPPGSYRMDISEIRGTSGPSASMLAVQFPSSHIAPAE